MDCIYFWSWEIQCYIWPNFGLHQCWMQASIILPLIWRLIFWSCFGPWFGSLLMIPLVVMGSMRKEEEMIKDPFWYFRVDRLWPFNFQPEIFKFEYLGFCSSDWETEDSFRKLEIERRHGEKTILIFWVFHLWKSFWLFTSPQGQFLA